MYDEPKKRISVAVTPTGERLLKIKAKSLGISVSEYVERIARDTLFEEEGNFQAA
ncbi:hypothetical protein F7734_00115 [Scytonema sp. UIC 10036]|uniref:hypothetical protein n=1 Tax=Scytonema sp. UIC 10036 TaxID=2304196 RepID=UPI0012DAC60D|nr:hypothetical protein [Scytonema sp. UIC 10036]MUG90997.1 hypothetical protein [Scytonema sp. UIC 10036]